MKRVTTKSMHFTPCHVQKTKPESPDTTENLIALNKKYVEFLRIIYAVLEY